MKVCPSCKTQYTDDSLAFCLQDGTPLVLIEPAFTGGGETDTVIRRREPRPENQAQSEVTRIPQPGGSGSKMTVIIIALVVGLIGVLIVLALGLAWLFWPPNQVANDNVANDRNMNVPSNINRRSPAPTPSPSPTSSLNVAFPTATPRSNTSDDVAISQVGATIERRREATNALDSESLMNNYAETVDYYRRGSVSSDFVLNDKRRAFERFTAITVTISNMSISIDQSGERATAEFDKAWVFQGARAVSGKARSQLRFARVSGKWLITGERDLSVYYTR